ncbi:hypothetical protein EM308_13890 [Flavobacterium gilvum]|uniref:histidine kinase n=2 Tax=Flavobacterium gilvum TaxID=1492737 RepID=A0AAC9I736_9FLAO|nr:hypothetical protein EM308_13890 [Flavobacterium gilvum]
MSVELNESNRLAKEVLDYKYALDQSAIVAITDQKGIITHVNDNFCKISKYSKEELIGQDHRIVNSGYHTKDFMKDLWRTIANGKVWNGEVKNRAKDGTCYWVDTTIVPFLNEQGKPYQYVSIRCDISDRKKGEEEFQEIMRQIEDYKYALDESSIVAVTNQKGIITHVNDNFCKISQYSREELIGQDHRIVNSGHHSKEFIRALWVAIANGKVWKGELKNKAKDGSFYWVDTIIVPFLNADGKPYQYVVIRLDVTDRKNRELERLKTAQALEMKNRQLVDFCNIVSHNLRAPMSNITMLIDLIKNTENDDEKAEYFNVVEKVSEHLNEIFEELIETVQVKQDAEIALDEINLQEIVNKTVLGFEAQIKLYDAVIETDFEEVPIVYFPQTYMDSMIQNFISNAFKYKSEDRKPIIKIKSEIKEDRVILSVSDNGQGIDMEKHGENMFKIRKTFHNHPDAKGFGLFMTKTQIETMGGEIWVESLPNEGTTFFVSIQK